MGKSKKLEKKSKKKHKHKDRKVKKLKKIKDVEPVNVIQQTNTEDQDALSADFTVPVDLMHSKSHAPETQEEYQRRQSKIRREVDPITKRIRLIKGDGEILEEIVSKNRHSIINKEATKSDGDFFQQQTLANKPKY